MEGTPAPHPGLLWAPPDRSPGPIPARLTLPSDRKSDLYRKCLWLSAPEPSLAFGCLSGVGGGACHGLLTPTLQVAQSSAHQDLPWSPLPRPLTGTPERCLLPRALPSSFPAHVISTHHTWPLIFFFFPCHEIRLS